MAFLTIVIIGCQRKDNPPKPRLESPEVIVEETLHFDAQFNNDGSFQVGSIYGILPEGWKSAEPMIDKYFAQIEIPAVENDPEPGQMAIFRFEEDTAYTQGEINRWYGQFMQRGGRPTVEVARWEQFDNNGLHIRMVRFTGTFRQSRQRGDPETSKKRDWMNVSAVVRTPKGDWFFKGTGPENTMKNSLPEIKQFLLDLDCKL